MTKSIRESVAQLGFAFIPEYRPKTSTAAVGNDIGQPLTLWKGRTVQELVPRACATPNTYSGIHGLGCFPFHTDLAHWRLPPRYLLLRCMTGYADVPTLLINGEALIEAVTLDILTRAIVKPRRPLRGAIALLHLCELDEEGPRLRWDTVFLKPASRVGEIASLHVREWLAQCEPLSISLTRAGDTLLIDNWRMLHARAQIPAGCEDRKIERVYLESLH